MTSAASQRGFSIIELLVTLVIVGILASAILPMAEMTVQRNKEQELRVALRTLRQAIDAYKQASDEGRIAKLADESGYPRTLSVLVDGVPDTRRPNAEKIRFLRRLPVDPFNPAANLPWGLRSYVSSHEDPKPGKDVFDVYSLTAGQGMNGVPYREW